MSTNASTNFVKNWILEKIQTAELKPEMLFRMSLKLKSC